MANNEAINFPPFDPDLEPTTIGIRFNKYIQRFQNYLIAMDVKDKARQRAIFLHCEGSKVQDIFDTLEGTGEDFETAGQKLLEYFDPKKHQLYNIYQFRQIAQQQDEKYDDYCTRLRTAAKMCEFPQNWTELEIQMQMIEKGTSKRVRRRILSKEHSLKEALDYARAQETADEQANRIEKGRHPNFNKDEHVEEINKVQRQQHFESVKRKCFNCGGIFPHPGGRKNCAALGKKCTSCQRYNHFAKCCRQYKNTRPTEYTRKVTGANEDYSASSSDAESTYHMDVVGSIGKKERRRPIKRVKIGDRQIKVLIDTGSTVNVMDEHTYEDMFSGTWKLRRTHNIVRAHLQLHCQ